MYIYILLNLLKIITLIESHKLYKLYQFHPPLWNRRSFTVSQAAVSGRDFKFSPETAIRKDGGAQPQSLISVPNISRLNLKSLRGVYVLKAYVLFIAICLLVRNVKLGGSLGAF